MDANTSWPWMIIMALTLGIRHGFDLDHLATIDAVARSIRNQPRISKMTGVLFSLGHGIVVTLISLIIGGGLLKAHIPEWLEGFGTGVSLFFLIVFGLINLWNVFQNSSSSILPVGIKSFLAKKIAGKKLNPFMIIFIGALFAFSFDTFSQVALFSISASLFAGWLFSGILGLSFTLGMMMSDGLNGLFVSALVQRADKRSLILSRGLGLTISLFSLAIAFTSILKLLQ